MFFQELGIPQPDYNLGVGSGTHGYQTGEMLKGIEHLLGVEKPDVVLVYGDTNSTLAGALAAAKLHIPVAHVEAGMRSFNLRMPEEINRVLTDHISHLLFCPTPTAVDNLTRENVTGRVLLTGDVMHDALCQNLTIAERHSLVLERCQLRKKEYLLVTVHRAENTDDEAKLFQIADALLELADSGAQIIFPVHPRTRKVLMNRVQVRPSSRLSGLALVNPVSYLDMLILEKNAVAILTDSGGVQKEAFWLSVPCVTLRDETEWQETVESGWNFVVGAHKTKIVECISAIDGKFSRPSPIAADGHAAERIVRAIAET
jgi:UDP-N-acetylglucosamine 2-epimerase (non-hydrolysing)